MENCYVEDDYLVCFCGKCKPEDYELPSDFNKLSTMKQPIEISEFENIVTDTCQGSKREVLERVLASIEDIDYCHDIGRRTNCEDCSISDGFNHACAIHRANVEKMLLEIK